MSISDLTLSVKSSLNSNAFPFLEPQSWALLPTTKSLFPWAYVLRLLLLKVWSTDQQHGHHLGVFGLQELQPPLQPCRITLHFTKIPGESRMLFYLQQELPGGSKTQKNINLTWVLHLRKGGTAGWSKLEFFLLLIDVWYIYSLKKTNLEDVLT